MYIPKPALEDCLTSEISASGGDVIYDYITGSQIRRVHYFGNTSGSHMFEVTQGCTDSTQLFLVGGGGAGGFGEDQPNGSGAPYNLPAPSSYIGCLNTTTQTAGGGGAGGVLNINPNLELTSSLAIVPGRYPIYIGSGGQVSGSDGENTTLKYPFRLANDADIPSGSVSSSRYDYDSVFIKAGGGGAGGSVRWTVSLGANCGFTAGTPHWQQVTTTAGDGGSGGGGSTTFCGDGALYIGDSGSVVFPFRNQGHEGSWYYSPWISSPSNLKGFGGGGASGSDSPPAFGPDQTTGGFPLYQSPRGYQQFYGVGGNAQDSDDCGTATVVQPGNDRDLIHPIFDSGSSMPYFKGSGGSAFVQEFTSSLTETYQDGYYRGVSGEAIVSYALTGSQLTQGKLHYIEGGASGGIFTFVPCGEVRLETLVVPAGKSACICAMDTGRGLYRAGDYNEKWYEFVDLQNPTGSDYDWEPGKMLDQLPSGSGTVTFTTGSECKAYVPFEGWEDCGSCKQSAPGGIYIGFDISGSSGRTYPLPYYKYPDTTIEYTSSQNYITSSRYNNHDSESYFQTRFGAISNDFDDDIPFSTFEPTASFSTSYADQNVDFTTGSECYTYYECDPLDPRPVTASGGEQEGTFISGSYVYKYHIFEPSGSSGEATQRTFQNLDVVGGIADDVTIAVIGPGGTGGKATGSFNNRVFYGGGGGAGQVQVTKVNAICGDYTLKIAPGYPRPFNDVNTQDDWQTKYGQTIVSASDGGFYLTSGVGGLGSSPGDYAPTFGWTERSGSGGGGAAIESIYPNSISGAIDTLQTDGGDGFPGTGSGAGGGGAAEAGFDGSGGSTAKGGEGGDGIRLNLTGNLTYYGGGGAGYGPGGPSDGGLGGGGDSGIGLSQGTYGGGGGAWLGPTQNVTYPWGTYHANGLGGYGAVIISYKWKFNTSPADNIVIRGLNQFYDMYSLDSYDGTGSLVYSIWNEGTASLGNSTGWEYNTTVLDGSGSLEVVSSSLHPYVLTQPESSSAISVIQTWFSNNVVYDASSSSYPILTDEQFGTSSFGMYAGNRATYDEAVVIRIGDTEIITEPDTAGEFVPRTGFHISQFSYNQNTNELLWYMDGYSGSATVNEDIDIRDITLSFNSSSLVSYPDGNPTYPSASQAVEYEIYNSGALDLDYQFTMPQTGQILSGSIDSGRRHIMASTVTPTIISGTGSISSGSAVDYYPSASIYPGRSANVTFDRAFDASQTKWWWMFYNPLTCQWQAETRTSFGTGLTVNPAQNTFITYPSYDTNIVQTFTGFNDCIERPPVGLGDDSSYNLTAIYTASLTWEEMKHNDDFLFPRY